MTPIFFQFNVISHIIMLKLRAMICIHKYLRSWIILADPSSPIVSELENEANVLRSIYSSDELVRMHLVYSVGIVNWRSHIHESLDLINVINEICHLSRLSLILSLQVTLEGVVTPATYITMHTVPFK